MNVCKEFDITPDEILNYKPLLPLALDMPDIYHQSKERVKSLHEEIQNFIIGLKKPISLSIYKEIESIYKEIYTIEKKPNIAFFGPSDAGKSKLINALTGVNLLLSKWTPMTSATVLLKHKSDKPLWMGEDDVWIFKAENSKKGWDIQQSNNQNYCEKLCIAKGKINVLEEFVNRNNKGKFKKRVDSAVVYLDSSILKACNIIDSPGFGTEEERDTILANRIFSIMDLAIFVCQSNSFFNRKEDISFVLSLVKELSEREMSLPLLNLFIVASQAHIVGKENLEIVFNRGIQAIVENYPLEQIKKDFSISSQQFKKIINTRFFSYSLERNELRTSLESALKYSLVDLYPSYKKHKQKILLDKFNDTKNKIKNSD